MRKCIPAANLTRPYCCANRARIRQWFRPPARLHTTEQTAQSSSGIDQDTKIQQAAGTPHASNQSDLRPAVAVKDLFRACQGAGVEQLQQYEAVHLRGWIKSIRKQKNVAFAMISDGSSYDSIQAVVPPEQASSMSTGTAVDLFGSLQKSKGRGQDVEFVVGQAKVLGDNDPERNPLQPKYQTPEYLRTIPHLRSRTSAMAVYLRLRSNVVRSITMYLEDWIQCHTPIITSSDCEGAGEVFTISSNADSTTSLAAVESREKSPTPEQFFKTPKYLTVSAQLHLEALAQSVCNVWTLSPTFRAEKSDTSRHLSEFYMLEGEMCFVNKVATIMDKVEDMIKQVVLDCLKSDDPLAQDLKAVRRRAIQDASANQVQTRTLPTEEDLEQRWNGIRNGTARWPRITYTEAIAHLQEAQEAGAAAFAFGPTYKDGLQIEHERFLARSIGNGSPVFVTDYPRQQKPFYMASSLSTADSHGTEDTVACFDLLVPDLGEIVGGSIRKHDVFDNLPGEHLAWYQDLRRFGSAPHGGFGLGFDRLLCYLAGADNIRDMVAFPRWYGRCEC